MVPETGRPGRVGQPTVGEVWHLALPAGTQMLAGEAGLLQPVEWVASLRASFPVFGDLGPGYLALARMSLVNQLETHPTIPYLITELHGASASGLVVDGEVSDEGLALADQLGFPVLAVPQGTDMREAERDILRALVDLESQLARREMQVRDLLHEAYSAGGIRAVLAQVAHVTASQVTLKDSADVEVTQAAVLVDQAAQEQVFPVVVAGRALGHLMLQIPVSHDNPLTDIYARQAADICGIEMLQETTRRETEERLGADLVEQLLDDQQDLEKVAARLQRLGYDLSPSRRHLVLAFAPEDDGRDQGLCEGASQDLRWTAERDQANVLVVRHRNSLLCFCSYDESIPDLHARRWVRDALATSRSARCHVGVSRQIGGVAELGMAVSQALEAASLGRRIAGRVGPHYYEELGLYRLLVGLSNRDELQRFFRETLGLLTGYDAHHNAELVHTLEVFFQRNANVSETARALYVHRNTLNYRLQRIVEITGLDLNDAEARLAFQLALKIQSLST